ncbi:helix-turn-helix transcriptional regulator [Paraburkholderia tropica]|uniref:helix-turn-helix transcriptional regulator n=1 Tax=Paraburkholderia tropica TaxID=92647 RepID=UPI003D2D93FB
MLPKLHRINAVAAALGVSRATVYRFVNEGKLTLVHLGKNSSAITEDSFRALLENLSSRDGSVSQEHTNERADVPGDHAHEERTRRKVYPEQSKSRSALATQIERAIDESSGHWHNDEFRIHGNGLKNLCSAVARIARESGQGAVPKRGEPPSLSNEQFDAIAYAVISLGMVIFQDADRLRHIKALRAVIDATSPRGKK